MSNVLPVYIGWDISEELAANVCRFSINRHSSQPVYTQMLKEPALRAIGMYRREWHKTATGQKIDNLDGKPFSTDFSFTRFLVPALQQYNGWALFCDCDILFTTDIAKLFSLADDRYACMVVKHDHVPKHEYKMDGQLQTKYHRKNWSSVVLWNCAHPANNLITPTEVNRNTGQWLHGFTWIPDDCIGELPDTWNWLEGHSPKPETPPAAIHFTRGGPWMKAWKGVDYRELWNAELELYRKGT